MRFQIVVLLFEYIWLPASEGYLLRKEQKPEFNLGLEEELVLHVTKDVEQLFGTAYFDNFFNSSKLVKKIFRNDIYGVGTVRAKRKQM